MGAKLIKNGTIVTLGEDNRIIKNGYILIKDNIISELGEFTPDHSISPETEIIDAHGMVVMPGFINQHMHFYSTFARGLCPKQPPASNFSEILERLWWPLDKTLNEKDIYYSVLTAAIDSIKNGVTTVFDHHESQGFQLGSLDVIETAMRCVDLRGNLSLGISDRYNKGQDGIDENLRFCTKIDKLNSSGDDLITSLFGFHAMFTVEDSTLHKASESAASLGKGFHVHVDEGSVDNLVNQKKFNKTPIARLSEAGCLSDKSCVIHGIYLSDEDISILEKSNTPVVHIPQSNMNNAVGVAPVLKMLSNGITVGIGTDGMSAGIQSDVKTANLLHKLHSSDPRVFFNESCELALINNSKIASRHFSKKTGVLEKGAYADIIMLNYDPPTEFNENNFYGHFLFGLCGAQVDTTIVNGKTVMKKGALLYHDEEEIMSKSREQANDFWKRF